MFIKSKNPIIHYAATWIVGKLTDHPKTFISKNYKTAREAAENAPKDAEIVRVRVYG